jgi:hypothetical protein
MKHSRMSSEGSPVRMVAVVIEIVWFTPGKEKGKGRQGKKWIKNVAISITIAVFLELHASYPTTPTKHKKQRTGCDDGPSYAHPR